jgi:hypothetical protein
VEGGKRIGSEVFVYLNLPGFVQIKGTSVFAGYMPVEGRSQILGTRVKGRCTYLSLSNIF